MCGLCWSDFDPNASTSTSATTRVIWFDSNAPVIVTVDPPPYSNGSE